jgi:hypothetical protein
MYHYQENGKEITRSNMLQPHNILKITLKNGAGVYAFEFGGSQYGRFDAVVPWDDYLGPRAKMVIEYHKRDTLDSFQAADEALTRQKQDSRAAMFLEILETFMKRQEITLDGVLHLSEKAFQEKHCALIKSLQLG